MGNFGGHIWHENIIFMLFKNCKHVCLVFGSSSGVTNEKTYLQVFKLRLGALYEMGLFYKMYFMFMEVCVWIKVLSPG